MKKSVSLKELAGAYVPTSLTLAGLSEFLKVSEQHIKKWEEFFGLSPEAQKGADSVYSKEVVKKFIKIKEHYDKGRPLKELQDRIAGKPSPAVVPISSAAPVESQVTAKSEIVAASAEQVAPVAVVEVATAVKSESTTAVAVESATITKSAVVTPVKSEVAEVKVESKTPAKLEVSAVVAEKTAIPVAPKELTAPNASVVKPEVKAAITPIDLMENPFEKAAFAATKMPKLKAVDLIKEESPVEISPSAALARPFLTQLNKMNMKVERLLAEKTKLIENTAIEKSKLISKIEVLKERNANLEKEKDQLANTLMEKEHEIKKHFSQETVLSETLMITQEIFRKKEDEIRQLNTKIEKCERELSKKDEVIQKQNDEIGELLEKQAKCDWWKFWIKK